MYDYNPRCYDENYDPNIGVYRIEEKFGDHFVGFSREISTIQEGINWILVFGNNKRVHRIVKHNLKKCIAQEVLRCIPFTGGWDIERNDLYPDDKLLVT